MSCKPQPLDIEKIREDVKDCVGALIHEINALREVDNLRQQECAKFKEAICFLAKHSSGSFVDGSLEQCTSLWHNEAHSYFSTCYECGKTLEQGPGFVAKHIKVKDRLKEILGDIEIEGLDLS